MVVENLSREILSSSLTSSSGVMESVNLDSGVLGSDVETDDDKCISTDSQQLEEVIAAIQSLDRRISSNETARQSHSSDVVIEA